ncbi:MAG: hypothetical protein H0W68_03825 [Gemmatimonadaceae bacterium]|nr:hypothetical protein [Gemmatimonadaceae bacterium]
MATPFGSADQFVKPRMKLVNWHQRGRLAFATATAVGKGMGLRARIRQFMQIARAEHMTRDLILIRCDRGADIARLLGFPTETAEAIRSLDEHWCRTRVRPWTLGQ